MLLRKDLTRREFISIMLIGILVVYTIIQWEMKSHDSFVAESLFEPIPKTYTSEIVDTEVHKYIGISEMIHDDVVTEIITEPEEEIDPISYNFELVGYANVNTELNIRSEPNTSSDIVGKLNWMDEVQYSVVNDDWACIKLDDSYGFIASRYITGDYETYTKTYSISGDKAKSYMDYRTITLKTSDQYKLQQRASTNYDNGLRILRGRYMVALGSYFNCNVGQFIDVILSDGVILPCIVGDAKQDIHTDSQNLHGLNGDTVEFIVNETILKDKTDVVGNISDVSDVFDGKVVEIRTYDHIEH